VEATQANRTRLRVLINERIPAGGTELDTKFLDAELDIILEESVSIWQAASTLWTMKAALLEKYIESYSVGNEAYGLTKLKDELEHALKMSQAFEAKAASAGGSYMLKVARPDVLGTGG